MIKAMLITISAALFLALSIGGVWAGNKDDDGKKHKRRIKIDVFNTVNLPEPRINIFGPGGDPGLKRSEQWLEERRHRDLDMQLDTYEKRLDRAEMKARRLYARTGDFDCWLDFFYAAQEARGLIYRSQSVATGDERFSYERTASDALWESESVARGCRR